MTKAKYAGTFGTYCCGNATITHNAILDTLNGTYGDCGNFNLVELVPEEHIFIMVFRQPLWCVLFWTACLLDSDYLHKLYGCYDDLIDWLLNW